MSTGLRNSSLGRYGEDVAARYLGERGLVLIDRNWTCPAGELDLVLRQGGTLIFCEVKTRTSTAHGHPLEAITPAKVARLRRLGDLWLEAHCVRPDGIRLDFVGVLRPRRGAAHVEHVPGVC